MIGKKTIFIFLVLTTFPGKMLAAEPTQLALQISGQEYRWQEFDSSGARLLRESGERFSLGAVFDNFRREGSGFLYSGSGRVYLGRVNYDGQTQAGVPVTTDVNYYGLNLEGLGGYRFGHRVGIDVFGGGGLDEWTRSLQDSVAADGTPAYGYDEFYVIIYARAGVGFFQQLDGWGYTLQGGVKMPVFTSEQVNIGGTDVFLSPGLKGSPFATVQFDFGASRRGRIGIALYYDSYRFVQSDPELVSVGGTIYAVMQPRSDMDVYGLRFNYYFF